MIVLTTRTIGLVHRSHERSECLAKAGTIGNWEDTEEDRSGRFLTSDFELRTSNF